MNSLSWFIYLTQITDNVREFGVGVSIIFGFAGAMGIGLFYIYTCSDCDADNKRDGWAFSLRRTLIRSYIAIMVPALLVAGLVPTRQTMLMIAGSEMGERLMKSNEANQGLDLIRKWIKQEADKIKDKS